jgi:glycosyltransferase involved in cell wall biosynthesis
MGAAARVFAAERYDWSKNAAQMEHLTNAGQPGRSSPVTSTELGTEGGRAAPQQNPFVSVIMAVRNEEGYIGPCLQALAQQDYPRERFEVIVLDGESTDGTMAEAQRAAQELGVPDAFLTNQKRTTASGMNLGLSLARGEIIIKVDGHTLVDPHFVSASVRALHESGADAVGGPIRTRDARSVRRSPAVSSPWRRRRGLPPFAARADGFGSPAPTAAALSTGA